MGVIFSLLRGEGHERRSQIQVTGNVYRNVYCKSGRIVCTVYSLSKVFAVASILQAAHGKLQSSNFQMNLTGHKSLLNSIDR